MEITFNLPYVFNPKADKTDNAYALRALLDCMVDLNVGWLTQHPKTPGLYQSGVKYGRTKLWEPIPALYSRKRGDCKSLATALIAQYKVNGIYTEPVFRFIQRNNGATDFHILVLTPSGFKDPSKDLGMGNQENQKFFGAESFEYRIPAHTL